jgi:cell division transport system ATP-binding protein
MVLLNQVVKAYSGGSRVLDSVDLKLSAGDFLYVVGGSGAGKTSLLRMLATEELPTSGKLSLFGFDLDPISPVTLRSIRRVLGYVPQGVKLIPDLTVYDNIAMSVSLAGRAASQRDLRARVGELLKKLDLAHARDHLASHLSGGEAQRAAVARALAREPELIIADEPTGAQDPDHTWALMDAFLKANQRGSTVVIATHDREVVTRVRKRCAVLKDGKIRLEGGGLWS